MPAPRAPGRLPLGPGGHLLEDRRLERGDQYSTSTASLKVGYSIGQSYSIADARINTFGDQVYTGKALTPKPKVEMQSTTRVDASSYSTKWITLTEGVDYRLSYSNNVNAGTVTVNIIGIGQYEGSAQRSFTTHRFKDVPASHWAHDVITRAAELGLINGFSNGNFGPDAKVARGQIAAILWNMAGKPAAGKGARSFPDVQGGAFYYDAVRWASSVGVVSGYGNGKFDPNDLVTREQLAVMLANYSSKVAGRQASGSPSDYASMSDASRVSSWARPSVGWCFRNVILSGKGGGRVDPQGNATRAESAKMVVYLHDMLA